MGISSALRRDCTVLHLAGVAAGTLLAGLAVAQATGATETIVTRSGKPLDLLLTQAELRAVVRNYEIATGENHTAPIDDDEVLVSAPGVQAPMRDPSQDIWGAIAAPFWAILHPKDAWRIFVPIPPRGGPAPDEPPAPDPR
jgi:hypothetical protein